MICLSPGSDDLFPDLTELVEPAPSDHPARAPESPVREPGPAAGGVLQSDGISLRIEADLVRAGDRAGPVARHVDPPAPARGLYHLPDLEERARRRVLLLAVVDLVEPRFVGSLVREQPGGGLGQPVE